MLTPSTTTSFKRGDVVLLPFPFTDLATSKYRPALIMSNDQYNAATKDLVVAQITGNIHGHPRQGDHMIGAFAEAGLPIPSVLRAKLATIASSLEGKTIGRIDSCALHAFEQNLRHVLSL